MNNLNQNFNSEFSCSKKIKSCLDYTVQAKKNKKYLIMRLQLLRSHIPALRNVIVLIGCLLLAACGGGGGGTTAGSSSTITRQGKLSVSSNDGASDYTVFNSYQTESPSTTGSFSTEISQNTPTYTFAVSKNGSKVYAAVNTSSDSAVTINAESTAEALVLMSPLLIPNTSTERAAITNIVKNDTAVHALATTIETAYSSSATPLTDTSISNALATAIESVLTTLQTTNTTLAKSILRTSQSYLTSDKYAATTSMPVLQILNNDMGALTLANSSGSTLNIALNDVGPGGITTNVDWVVRIVELDPNKITWSPSGTPLLGDPTNITNVDSLIKSGGYNQTTIVDGKVASGVLGNIVDPIGSVANYFGDALFPGGNIKLPPGIYAIIALSGSPYGDSAEYTSVESSSWQSTLATQALTLNIGSIAVDVVGIVASFGHIDITPPLETALGVIKTQITANPSGVNTAVVVNDTNTVIDSLMNYLNPILHKSISTLQLDGVKQLLHIAVNSVTSVVKTWSGTVDIGARVLNFINDVTPREYAYVSLASACSTGQVFQNGLCVSLPSINTTAITNGATGVSVNSAVSATFNVPVDTSTLNSSTFTVVGPNGQVTGAISYDSTTNTVIFTPTTILAYNTTYTATITTGVTDTSGNALGTDYSWNFTTSGPSISVSTVSPANGATSVDINTPVSVTFSGSLSASSVTTSTFTLTGPNGTVSGAVAYNSTANTATFTPTSPLSNGSTYTATISTGITDANGNPLASNYSWTFSTSPATTSIYPRFLYVADATNNNVSTYAINNTTGRLLLASRAFMTTPFSMAIGPNEKYAYVASGTVQANNQSNVFQYSINSDGSLSPLNTATVYTGRNPKAIAVDPSGNYAYIANRDDNDITQYTIGADGSLTPMSTPTVATGAGTGTAAATAPDSIAIDPSGKYLYVANEVNGTNAQTDSYISQFSIGTNGSLTPLSTATVPSGLDGRYITVDPSGKYVYAANVGDNTIYQYIIGANGALTPMSTPYITAGTEPDYLYFDPSGKYLYVSNSTSDNIMQYTINPDGSLTQNPVSTISVATPPHAVVIDPTDKFAYAIGDINGNDGTISQFTIDSSGSLIPNSPATIYAHSTPESLLITYGANPVATTPQYAYVANTGSDDITQYSIGTNGSLAAMSSLSTPTGTSPFGIAIDPTRHFAYVTNEGDTVNPSTVSEYTIGSDGILAPMSTASVAADVQPMGIAVGPSGRYAYVTNAGSNDISQYSIGSDGILTPMTTPTVSTGSGSASMAIDPSGQYAYVANGLGDSISQFTIGTDGSLTPMAPTTVTDGSGPESITIDPSGQYVYVANNSLNCGGSTATSNTVSQYTIGTGGALTPMSTPQVSAGICPGSVTIDPSGKYAYVTNQGDGVNPGTVSQYIIGSSGLLTPMSTPQVTVGVSPNKITIDPSGKYAYVTNYGDGTVSQFTIGLDGSLSPMSVPTASADSGPTRVVTVGSYQ